LLDVVSVGKNDTKSTTTKEAENTTIFLYNFVPISLKYITTTYQKGHKGMKHHIKDMGLSQIEKFHKIWNFSIWNKLNQILVGDEGLEPPTLSV
jgi:hypothetical protein